MTPNYYDYRVRIPPHAFPWTVGHRLKKSVREGLPWNTAKRYYRELAHCKTRYRFQEIPLSILISRTFGKRAKDFAAAVNDRNPILAMLKRKGAITAVSGGHK